LGSVHANEDGFEQGVAARAAAALAARALALGFRARVGGHSR
jgi:hypothetical protein